MKYYIPDYGEIPADAEELKPRWKGDRVPDDPSYFAQMAADYVHSNRDGWESSWPIEFVVIDDGGTEHRFSVDRETVPEFHATPIKTHDPRPKG